MTRRVMDRAPMEEALHQLMGEDYSECSGRTVRNGYIAFYHEKGLYSVEHVDYEIMCLVFAANPYEAIDKVAMFRGDSQRCADECVLDCASCPVPDVGCFEQCKRALGGDHD